MATMTVNSFTKIRVRAHNRILSREPVRSLQDLLDVLARMEPEHSHTLAMLRTTCAHISMCIGEPPAAIPIRRLLDVKPRLRAYLMERGLKRNSIRSYVNFLRILLHKAKSVKWVDYPLDLTKAWRPMLKAVSTVRGCKGIVHYAIRVGRTPREFSNSDLVEWREAELKNSRRHDYLRNLAARFLQCILETGLGSFVPNLLAPQNREAYGIPVLDFPEPLKTQTLSLLDWKTARYSQGRPNRAKLRSVSAKVLEGHFSRLFGFVPSVKQRELSAGVRRLGRGLRGGLKAVALRHPVMPVANGLGG